MSVTPQARTQIAFKKPAFWVRVCGSGLLIGVLIWQLGVADVLGLMRRLSLTDVLVAWLLYLCCQWMSAVRWKWLLLGQGLDVSTWRLLNFYMVGMFMNNFLPGAVGGDVVKGYDLYRHVGRAEEATISVFLERFTGLVGLGLLALLASALYWRELRDPIAWVAIFGAAAVLALASVAIWHPRVHRVAASLLGRLGSRAIAERFDKLSAAVRVYRDRPAVLWKAIGLSLVIQIGFAVYYSVLGDRMGIHVAVHHFVLFLPVVTLVSLIPVSIGGLGLRETAMATLFGSAGYPPADVVAISLAAHLINAVLSLWGGGILVFRLRENQIACST